MSQASPASEQGLTTTVRGLLDHVGTHLGTTDWRTLSQEQVDAFADLTDDHNFIHVDPERAAQTPFGGTIVHGYLTLAMLSPASFELLRVQDAKMGVNYGIDRLRFPAPLPVGARFRTSMELTSAREVKGDGVEAHVTATVEVEGSERPAVVADCLFRYYA
ncbi:MAG TPA: MaoC family dehydratase [Solirubrobacteraceae bacterium]|jgi:acyl dehydratase|nr:MaoC family dehydratase [Solirubrobacteraceae bacterium]